MTLGAPIEMVGPVLSTVNVPLGPAAGAKIIPSVAVPAAIDIPIVPSPVIPLSVTVRVTLPVPVTTIVLAVADPPRFNEISVSAKVTAVAPP